MVIENDFEVWFKTKLQISSYPDARRLTVTKPNQFDMVINVSDEFYINNSMRFSESGYMNYWFPLSQSSSNMGMISLFGALQVLYKCYEKDMNVLLHCRKGKNRSQVVRSSFYYMITEKQLEEQYTNMLLVNCKNNHLPDIKIMQNWLLRCKKAFNNQKAFYGNMLDWCFKELDATLIR